MGVSCCLVYMPVMKCLSSKDLSILDDSFLSTWYRFMFLTPVHEPPVTGLISMKRCESAISVKTHCCDILIHVSDS
jgi:hypothetical protein